MAVAIQVDQAAAPAGTPGQAREDLATGVPVTLAATGGPFLSQLWTILHRPIDIMAGTRSACALTAPTASSTQLTPIDVPGTYRVRCTVDSGSGLGATPDDVADMTFYAGPTLATSPDSLPRRIPAFGETLEHNVPDAIEIGGNSEGWSREWYRWFALMQRLYEGHAWSWGRISLPAGGPAAITSGYNVATATRTAQGIVDIAFTTALPNANYAVICAARSVGGSAIATTEAVGGFTIERADLAGALVDADFVFAVRLEV